MTVQQLIEELKKLPQYKLVSKEYDGPDTLESQPIKEVVEYVDEIVLK